MFKKTIISLLSLLFLTFTTIAQEGISVSGVESNLINEKFVLSLLVVVLLLAISIILLLSYWIINLTNRLHQDLLKEKGITVKPEEDLLSKLFKTAEQQLTDAVPVEREDEIVFEHEYDGIRELDNNLPPWWKYMFYISIVFAVVYLFHYHVIGSGALPMEEYQIEMAEAALQKEAYLKKAANLVDESTVEAFTDEANLAKGKSIFITYCLACHGSQGEGGVGPNMTDEYWIHGGGIKNIFKVIKYGVPAKGMIAWQTQLKPQQIQQVSSYILTLQGTNPPNQKEPEGERYIPDDLTDIEDIES